MPPWMFSLPLAAFQYGRGMFTNRSVSHVHHPSSKDTADLYCHKAACITLFTKPIYMLHSRTSHKNKNHSCCQQLFEQPAQMRKSSLKKLHCCFQPANSLSEKNAVTKMLQLTPIFVGLPALCFKSYFRSYVDPCSRWWVSFCWHTKEFHNSLEWSIFICR